MSILKCQTPVFMFIFRDKKQKLTKQQQQQNKTKTAVWYFNAWGFSYTNINNTNFKVVGR